MTEYFASFQGMTHNTIAYSDDFGVRITVGEIQGMQGRPSFATLLALLFAESAMRNCFEAIAGDSYLQEALEQVREAISNEARRLVTGKEPQSEFAEEWRKLTDTFNRM